jgi:hypothetical protein
MKSKIGQRWLYTVYDSITVQEIISVQPNSLCQLKCVQVISSGYIGVDVVGFSNYYSIVNDSCNFKYLPGQDKV